MTTTSFPTPTSLREQIAKANEPNQEHVAALLNHLQAEIQESNWKGKGAITVDVPKGPFSPSTLHALDLKLNELGWVRDPASWQLWAKDEYEGKRTKETRANEFVKRVHDEITKQHGGFRTYGDPRDPRFYTFTW